MNLIKKHNIVNKSEIARIVGYSPRYVSYLLKGERTNPKALDKVMQAIRKYLSAA